MFHSPELVLEGLGTFQRALCSLNRRDLGIVPFLQISLKKLCFVSQFSLEKQYGGVWSQLWP